MLHMIVTHVITVATTVISMATGVIFKATKSEPFAIRGEVILGYIQLPYLLTSCNQIKISICKYLQCVSS